MLERNVRFEELMPLIRERIAAGESVRFSPNGISMLPMLRPGVDSVVLSPLPEKLKKYDLPFYQREDGTFVLHRVVAAGDKYTCVGDNQFRLEPGLDHAQMIGLVTAFTKNGREHSVDELGYRIYCRIWYYSRPVRFLWRFGIGCLRRIFR